jgi:CheY-like chemotaxis protein
MTYPHLVLVVDDDEDVRDLAVTIISELDLPVVGAANGQDALSLLLQHPDIDLLVTDICMPGMNGFDLAAQARELRPDLKIMYTSGFTRERRESRSRIEAPLLAKPYRASQLEAEVRKLLAA